MIEPTPAPLTNKTTTEALQATQMSSMVEYVAQPEAEQVDLEEQLEDIDSPVEQALVDTSKEPVFRSEGITATETHAAKIEVVIARVEEGLGIDEEQVVKANNVLEIISEEVVVALNEFFETADEEIVRESLEQIMQIAEAADRLHVLIEGGEAESEEALQIEEVLRGWFIELLETVSIEYDEEMIEKFIASIKSESYSLKAIERQEADYLDEGMKEMKSSILDYAQDFSQNLAGQFHIRKLGRLSVGAVAS